MGIVDADALPTSEKLSPAAPSTFTAAALVVRFFFEACLTRAMVASSVSSCENAWQACAPRNWRARVARAKKSEKSHRVPFIFMKSRVVDHIQAALRDALDGGDPEQMASVLSLGAALRR